MKVKVSIPKSLDDITTGQFQQLDVINNNSKDNMTDDEVRVFDNKIVSLFTGIEDVDTITEKDRNYVLESVGKALVTKGEFKDRFTIGGIEFGMTPNLDKVYGKEYTDLIKYYGKTEELHRFMAVAFRPIKLKDVFKSYIITDYKGTSELSELMKQTPMSIVKGFDAFFLTLSNDLEVHIQRSILEEQAKEIAL